VDTAASAAEALNKLHFIPGRVDAVIVDMTVKAKTLSGKSVQSILRSPSLL
jgi:hypothetical protein